MEDERNGSWMNNLDEAQETKITDLIHRDEGWGSWPGYHRRRLPGRTTSLEVMPGNFVAVPHQN